MTALTGTNVADRVKRQFGDEAAAQITDAMLLDYINDAMREIVSRNDELFQAKAAASTVNGTESYDLPTLATNILRLNTVKYKGVTVDFLSIQQADETYPEKDVLPRPTGMPRHYWIWANKIIFEPAPDSTGSNLVIYFQTYPTPLSTLSDTIPLPERYHLKVVDYCIAKAAELDDDDERHGSKMAQLSADLDMMNTDTYRPSQETYPYVTVSTEDMFYGY